MFETLLSKTLLLLASSLVICCLGAMGTIKCFRLAYNKGSRYVTAKNNDKGELDLVVDKNVLLKLFWSALIVNVIVFVFLMIYNDVFPINMFMMGIFTFTDGITIALALLEIDENIGVKVTKITACITLLASFIAMYSGMDFSFLEKGLFFALSILLVISIYRIFHSIEGFPRKVIASLGILTFIGYLLLDFNRLSKAEDVALLNNWNTALDFAINIYLDIINLFVEILDLLSS